MTWCESVGCGGCPKDPWPPEAGEWADRQGSRVVGMSLLLLVKYELVGEVREDVSRCWSMGADWCECCGSSVGE